MQEIPPMTVAFISDIHLARERPAAFELFEKFMVASRRLEQLYILGDLFDYWVGDDGAETLGYTAVEELIRKAVDARVRVFFLHGNRDFLVGEQFLRRTGCELLPDPSIVSLYGRNFLLSHGDSLCTDDVKHQEWRKSTHSPQWKSEFLKQPLEDRISTAIALRRHSETGKLGKDLAIMDVTQTAVEKLLRQYNVNTMIHGHTHRPAVHEFTLDKKPAWRYVLGEWGTRNSVLYYQHGILTLKK